MGGTDAFLDTNVLLYLLSGEAAKADRAEALLAGGGTVSVQVLNEFAAVARRKLAMPWPEVREVLATVRAVCAVVPVTEATHDLGVAVAERDRLSGYDGPIVGAARPGGRGGPYPGGLPDGPKGGGGDGPQPLRPRGGGV